MGNTKAFYVLLGDFRIVAAIRKMKENVTNNLKCKKKKQTQNKQKKVIKDESKK